MAKFSKAGWTFYYSNSLWFERVFSTPESSNYRESTVKILIWICWIKVDSIRMSMAPPVLSTITSYNMNSIKFWQYKICIDQKQPSEVFCKNGVLKNFARGQHLCWSLFVIKLQAFSPATLLKRDSNTGVFLWNLWNSNFLHLIGPITEQR